MTTDIPELAVVKGVMAPLNTARSEGMEGRTPR
jgi:hypothetical protein